VNGDSGANDILVSGNIGIGYTVTGQNGTKVNSGASAHVDPTGGQRANVDVSLGSGSDSVEFNNFAALAVSASGGSGNDTIKFFNVTAFNGIKISGASGNDKISLDFVDIHQGLNISTASGNDTVAFGNTFTGVTLFDGDANINGASGHDVLTGRANLHTATSTQKIHIHGFESVT
jgi:hypothetical protein